MNTSQICVALIYFKHKLGVTPAKRLKKKTNKQQQRQQENDCTVSIVVHSSK